MLRRIATGKYRSDLVRMYRLLQKLPTNRETTCLGNLLTHAVVELDQYINCRKKSVYLLASLVRSLFELCLVVQYILKSPDNLVDWMGQRISDEIGILESARLLSARPGDTDWINGEVCRLKALSEKEGIPVARYRLPSYYSKVLGRRHEYDKFTDFFPNPLIRHPGSLMRIRSA